ncbi:glycoside hydrolase family 31 protein [Negadavirga shengliensis]|uniref:Glycoside hydrolase family 31 protein n=1 Tax=Negadavirga shengliensis TaxID=1389218 RepID=A0ABV9T1U3_9BACT
MTAISLSPDIVIPGSILEYSPCDTGIIGRTENGCFKLTVYSANIIRVQVSRAGNFAANPYSVVSQPVKGLHGFSENQDHILFSTAAVSVFIQKSNFALTFKNKNGEILNEDVPAFGINWLGTEVSCYKKLRRWEKFIGLGEKTGGLNRYGQAYVNWNTDHFSYGIEDDPLYISIPFYIGLHHHLVYGIFFDNTHKTVFNFGASNNHYAYFSAEDGDMDYYFFQGDTVSDIITGYTDLTGRMELPPLWALGYQQCHYSYFPDKEVMRLAQTFREKDIPADVIYLDIHYMEKFKVFTFDKKNFPDPKSMISTLKSHGFKVVVILDPGIKIEDNYDPYMDGQDKDVFLKYPDGSTYEGPVWPGWCAFPDFTNGNSRKWWTEKMRYYMDLGVDGFWVDMNEPSAWGQFIPNIVQFNYEGAGGSHKKGRNIYGMQMARSSKEGALLHSPQNRAFVLTRSGYSGVQRFAAVWTGDNVASDEHMLAGIRLVNSLGISGMAFSGYDIGGFAGNASAGLFARWIGIAVFSPLFRVHSMINSHDSEPWSYGEEVEEISRNHIKLRYRLLPTIYNAFYKSSLDGLPIAKSLAVDYPFDDLVFHGSYQNQYLFCDSFLVAPVDSHKEIIKIYLPQSEWYHFFDDRKYNGNQEIYFDTPLNYLPVFVKAGSIIFLQGNVAHSGDPHDGILRIHLYKGNGETHQIFYEDDGISNAYKSGKYYLRNIYLNHDYQHLRLETMEGEYQSSYRILKLYFHGFTAQYAEINGKETILSHEDVPFLDKINEYDPFPSGRHPYKYCLAVPCLEINHDHDPIHIQLK